MNTAKHTPGPWVVNEEGRMVEAQVPNLRNEYEHICDLRGGIRGQINTANAHLIAAAPAMYEALQAAHKLLREWTPSGEDNQGEVECLIENALAQAAGSKP